MTFRFSLPLVCLLACAATSCSTLYTRRIEFKKHPIALRVENKVVDEETIEYVVKFRNTGREVVSFDYTIADEGGVPHVDSDGPNSGFIPNLYPGVEVEVKNPTKKLGIWATLGTVTYGKRTSEELAKIYKPDKPAGVPGEGTGLLPMPVLDSNAPNP